MQIRPVILCGGSGTRLWPLSTPEQPKQFLSLTAPETMIALTSSRLKTSGDAPVQIDTTLVVGSARHEALLRAQLPGAQLILEPFGRNSAPAVAAACLASQPGDILLILPADHDIRKPDAFLAALALAHPQADSGAIVTFGIQPDHPATGYGYIEAEPSDTPVRKVRTFVEKPELAKAQAYLEHGDYFWNAGIFMFKASTMLTAFAAHAPDILEDVRAALQPPMDGVRNLDTAGFGKVRNISIDYAIMEHETNIKVVPVDMAWSDVGDYQALWQMFAQAPADNVTFGPAFVDKSSGLYIRSEGPTVSVSGLDDCIIVAKPDLVMISRRGDADAVKLLGSATQARGLGISLSSATRQAARTLLWDAFDTWADLAWDEAKGGFVEALTMDGKPDFNADRRVRVQARQVFSFARAVTLGWPGAERALPLISKGLDYLTTKCRHQGGGWVHRLNGQGEIIDPVRDLYDHAFIMMAGAAAFEATGSASGLAMAQEALAFIDDGLKDDRHGGYFEGVPAIEPRRANPHMHLLEAFLVLHGATGEATYLRRATEMVELFETRLFSARDSILREFFTLDWSPAAGDMGRVFEPGHHYEWATLLAMHDKLTGRDTASWRRRLIRTADQKGTDVASGLVHNSALPDGTPMDAKRRIWGQLEMFRARLWHPASAGPGDADRIFSRVVETYFKPMPKGMWLDETDQNGTPTSSAIPASILYHLVTALTPALTD